MHDSSMRSREEIERNLEKVEGLAKGSKAKRLLAHPPRYFYSVFYKKFIYPQTKKGLESTATTFFGAKMKVALPAAIDIYITGGKTHDSEIRLTRFLIKNLKEEDQF